MVAVMNDQMHEEHQDEDGAEGDDDGCAGWRVQLDAEPATQSRDHGAHGPADGETRADAIREEHCADAWNNQVAKNEEHTGDGDGRSYDKSE